MNTRGCILTAAFYVAGCVTAAPAPERGCVTVCGQRLYGSDDCEGFQLAEDRAIQPLSNHFKRDACAVLNGAAVTIMPTASWVDAWDRKVAGLANCEGSGWVQVGRELDWRVSSLAHEQAHLMECPWVNVDHEGWDAVHPVLQSINR